MKAVTEMTRPKVFYHGTQVAIHTLAEPCLDPKFAQHQDEGDPEEPHVFVTPNRLQAAIFSLKVKEAIEIEADSDGGSIVYSRLPRYLHGGWLYICPENSQQSFRQILVRGQRTDKWVSPERVPVTQPVFIPGLKYLAQRGLQIYVLGEDMSPDMWSDISRNSSSAHRDLEAFYREHVLIGDLRLVNL